MNRTGIPKAPVDGVAIWAEIVELHRSLGLPLLSQLGIWKRELPGGWYMAVNGTMQTATVEPIGGMAFDVSPCCAAFWFNGWIAGELHPIDGGALAAGDAANAETLLEALRLR